MKLITEYLQKNNTKVLKSRDDVFDTFKLSGKGKIDLITAYLFNKGVLKNKYGKDNPDINNGIDKSGKRKQYASIHELRNNEGYAFCGRQDGFNEPFLNVLFYKADKERFTVVLDDEMYEGNMFESGLRKRLDEKGIKVTDLIYQFKY